MKSSNISRVLMVDDDESLVGVMAIRLRQSGYDINTATKSDIGYTMACEQQYDVLILDVTMPGLTGFEICKNLRAKGILTPILLLSGHAEKPSIIQGLEAGADDYLTKPFSHIELEARLQALIRRNKRTFSAHSIDKSGLKLDVPQSCIKFGGQVTQLTVKEALLLRRLMYEAPGPVDRNRLLKDVWGIDETHTSNRLDVYVRRLRSKLERVGADHLIHTVRGNGYYFGE